MKKSINWLDPARFVEKIHIEESCLDLPYVQEIIQRAQLPWTHFSEKDGPLLPKDSFEENLSSGKRHLVLGRYKGKFFKACPGTREYLCCGYHVLTTGLNCPIDCVYCILQAYLNSPWLSVFVNTDDLLAEVDEQLTINPDRIIRIGTGEFTDSLALDSLTHLSKQLVPFFAKYQNAYLELKTKSGVIENLRNLHHCGKTIVSWSLNSKVVMENEEIRAATLHERLSAARQCVEWGYPVAFHFDPLIFHDNWQDGYTETVREIYRTLPASSIRWISLGALRYLPKLKSVANSRFPHSKIYFHEFIEGLDGKSRYFRFSREKLYTHVYQEIRKYADPSTCVYFCMESDEMWRAVMGYLPAEKGGLAAMLDCAAAGHDISEE